MTYAFAAAGTGGHVYPALATADELVSTGVSRDDIVFFGGYRMETEAVPGAGYELVRSDIRGLRRSLSPDNLKLPMVVRKATREMEVVMRRRNVKVVIAFGGYVAVPAARAGSRIGATIFLHEQNAIPGLANRYISSRTHTSFVAFPEAATRLRHAKVVGNPLRPPFVSFDRGALRAQARRRYGLADDVIVIGVLGGSLGAKVLNDVTARIVADLDPGEIAVLHLTGKIHIDDVRPEAERSAVAWRAVAFEEEMQHFYAAADMVLSRAGALTVSELAATGTPAVVVPFAAGTADHQAANVAHLEAAGGCIVVPEGEIDRAAVEIQQLVADPARRAAMAEAAAKVGRPDAASVIATVLREAARDH